MGDEETFATLELAKEKAQAIADTSGRHVDVVDNSTEETVYVARPLA